MAIVQAQTLQAESAKSGSDVTTLALNWTSAAQGDVLVIWLYTWDNTISPGTPSGGSQAYDLRLSLNPAGFQPRVALYTATLAAGVASSFTTTIGAPAAGCYHMAVGYRLTGAQLAASPAVGSGNNTAASLPSFTITTTGTGSQVFAAIADIQSISPATDAFGASATRDVLFDGSGSASGVYRALHQAAASAGSQTVSMSAPSGQKWVGGAIEVQQASSAQTKSLAGATTPTGAVAKRTARALTAATAPSGAVARLAARALSGASAPSGALVKRAARLLAGTLTSSGALSRAATRLLAGTTAPSGALSRRPARQIAGTTSPSGAVGRAASRLLGGATTPTGALAAARTRLLALAGATTPAGALVHTTARILAGASSPTGAARKSIARALAGATAPAGAVRRMVGRLLSGALTAAGSVAKSLTTPADQRDVTVVVAVGPDTRLAAAAAARALTATSGARPHYAAALPARSRWTVEVEMTEWRLERESKELIGPIVVTADGDPVSSWTYALLPRGTRPASSDAIIAAPTTVSSQQYILVGPGSSNVLDRGQYRVWIRFTDSPEIPVLGPEDNGLVIEVL